MLDELEVVIVLELELAFEFELDVVGVLLCADECFASVPASAGVELLLEQWASNIPLATATGAANAIQTVFMILLRSY